MPDDQPKKPSKPRRTAKQRAVDDAKAQMAELFEAGVLLLPTHDKHGNSELIVEGWGHDSFRHGLIADAYAQTCPAPPDPEHNVDEEEED